MKQPHEINILVGCEESQAVCKAFRERGFNAFSCDTQECSGGHPEWHIQGPIDVIAINNEADPWHAGIFFPPCTYLTSVANSYFKNNPERWEKRLDSVKLVYTLMNCGINHWAIENPKGAISSYIRKSDQTIQPYEYGHPYTKQTCLWVRNLPLLKPTNIVDPIAPWVSSGSSKNIFTDYSEGGKRNSKQRSKTFPGIAAAMAQQWGDYLLTQF